MATTDNAIHIRTYNVDGMTCEHCVRAVIAEVSQLPGVQDVQVSLFHGTARVSSESALNEHDISSAIEEAGYRLIP